MPLKRTFTGRVYLAGAMPDGQVVGDQISVRRHVLEKPFATGADVRAVGAEVNKTVRGGCQEYRDKAGLCDRARPRMRATLPGRYQPISGVDHNDERERGRVAAGESLMGQKRMDDNIV